MAKRRNRLSHSPPNAPVHDSQGDIRHSHHRRRRDRTIHSHHEPYYCPEECAMKMNPSGIISGCLIIFSAVFLVTVLVPRYRETFEPSVIFRARTPLEEEGRRIFIQNGCS